MEVKSQQDNQPDRFTSDLEPFINEAMLGVAMRTVPLSQVRTHFERLIAAVYWYGRTQEEQSAKQKETPPEPTPFL